MFTSGVNQYSQSSLYQSTAPASAKESNGASFSVSDDLLDQKRDGMERILKKVEEDNDFAKEMVELHRTIPNRLMFNLKEARSTPGGLEHIQKQTAQFNEQASKVSAQREALYSSMRDQNYDDATIFKAFREFNNSLPSEYRQMAGIVKVDTKA